METILYHKHYITVDGNGLIRDGFSDAFRAPSVDDTCINERGGYQFRLAPNGAENPVLYSCDGIPIYRWDGTQVLLRAEGEVEADRAAIPAPPITPTNAELMEAILELAALLTGEVS